MALIDITQNSSVEDEDELPQFLADHLQQAKSIKKTSKRPVEKKHSSYNNSKHKSIARVIREKSREDSSATHGQNNYETNINLDFTDDSDDSFMETSGSCRILLLQCEEAMEVCLDLCSWHATSQFKGMKFIPPGPHFLHWSIRDYSDLSTSGEFVTIEHNPYDDLECSHCGEFLFLQPGGVAVRRWNSRKGGFEMLDDPEEERRYRFGVRSFDFDSYMAPYSMDQVLIKRWNRLTSCVSPALVRRVGKSMQWITSSYLTRNDSTNERNTRQSCKFSAVDNIGNTSGRPDQHMIFKMDISQPMTTATSSHTSDATNCCTGIETIINQVDLDDTLSTRDTIEHCKESSSSDQRVNVESVDVIDNMEMQTKINYINTPSNLSNTGKTSSPCFHDDNLQCHISSNRTIELNYSNTDNKNDIKEIDNDNNNPSDSLGNECVYDLTYSDIPEVRLNRKGKTPNEISKMYMDKSSVLEEMVIRNKGDFYVILGEFQFAFVTFLLTYNLDSFIHWKNLLILFSESQTSASNHPAWYEILLQVIYYQMLYVPEDFFHEEITGKNFLAVSLRNLYEVCSVDGSTELMRCRSFLRNMLLSKFHLDISDDLICLDHPEFGPVLADDHLIKC